MAGCSLVAALAAVALLLPVFTPHALAQEIAQEPDEDVTQLSVTLVQIDAVVTDGDGHPVRDLRAGDFEILEDGRPQQITGFSFVSVASGAETASARSRPSGQATTPAPPAEPSPDDVRRTLAFVVDDLFLSAESFPKIKLSMHEFVDEEMREGDLVAIITTSAGGAATLQRFTFDRAALHAAIDALHWNARGFNGASAFTPPDESILNNRPTFGSSKTPERRRSGSDTYREQQAKRSVAQVDQHRTQGFAVTMLGSLGETVQSLDSLPGRKSVVLFSEGFRALGREFVRAYENGEGDRAPIVDGFGGTALRGDTGILGLLRRVVDAANRAAVTIYAVDPRGVVDPSLASAQYSTLVMDRERRAEILGGQRDNYLASSTALHYLADQTGGEVSSSNDPSYGIRRALDGLSSYYSLAYTPETTFEPKERPVFHEITVRVKRPGLKVRARSGFYGVTDEQLRRGKPTAERIADALVSPFGSRELDVRISSQFILPDDGAPAVRTVVDVDASTIAFAKTADGANEATVEVYTILLDEKGAVAAKAERSNVVRLDDAELARARLDGLTFVVNVPVKGHGLYRVRAAVREKANDRIGSATRSVTIPKVGSGKLALSGVVLGSAGSYTRRYRPGSDLRYAFIVYDATAAGSGPKLEMQVSVWRDGTAIYRPNPAPMMLEAQKDWRRIDAVGGLKLSPRIAPGRYKLAVTISDTLARGRPTATEWVDFEVVP